MFSTTVGLDNYYLQYQVKVAAYNDLGHGPNSTEQIVFSAEGSKYKWLYFFINPLPDMPILGFSNSAAYKDMMSEIWTNGDTII